MTDLEYKLLFSVMAGFGYKLFLSTSYWISGMTYFFNTFCKCFMNICMKQFYFILSLRFRGEQSLWNDIN